MARSGRLAWRGLALRVALPMELLTGEPAEKVIAEPGPQGLWTELAAPEPPPAPPAPGTLPPGPGMPPPPQGGV